MTTINAYANIDAIEKIISTKIVYGTYVVKVTALNGIPLTVLGLPDTEVAFNLHRDGTLVLLEPTNSPNSFAEDDSEVGRWEVESVRNGEINLNLMWVAPFVDGANFLTLGNGCQIQTCLETVAVKATYRKSDGEILLRAHVSLRGADGQLQVSPFYLPNENYWQLDFEGGKFEFDSINSFYNDNDIDLPAQPSF